MIDTGDKNLKLVFNSSLDNIVSCNSSFDVATMRIAYHGQNKNNTYISKETFDRCANTMFNVPVVANYIREDESIGGHDMEIVRKQDGKMYLVNITHPVGVVPESASYYWETVTEDDGTEHEYLCTDVLLWKRQEAYDVIKDNGITSESMEIDIKDGHQDGGIYYIEDFQFLAFCLLGDCSPCFESASVTTFSKDIFEGELRSMLSEVPSAIKKYEEEVSNKAMNKKIRLMNEYGLKIEDLDFELADFSLDELKLKFEAIRTRPGLQVDDDGGPDSDVTSNESEQDGEEDSGTAINESTPVGADSDGDDNNTAADSENDSGSAAQENYSTNDTQQFSLLDSELCGELRRVLSSVRIRREWGETDRYWLLDYDAEAKVVYCEDCGQKCITVRMNYKYDGDTVVIDFASAKRVKRAYVDFEDGMNSDDVVDETILNYTNAVIDSISEKYAGEKAAIGQELETLRKFKADTEKHMRDAAECEVFSEFSDLDNIQEFSDLKKNCAQFDIETIREKCYAIRGKTYKLDFSLKPHTKRNVVIPVGGQEDHDYIPYGGIVEKFRK